MREIPGSCDEMVASVRLSALRACEQVYVPYFRHPEKKEEGDVDGDDFLAAQEHPATFYQKTLLTLYKGLKSTTDSI